MKDHQIFIFVRNYKGQKKGKIIAIHSDTLYLEWYGTNQLSMMNKNSSIDTETPRYKRYELKLPTPGIIERLVDYSDVFIKKELALAIKNEDYILAGILKSICED